MRATKNSYKPIVNGMMSVLAIIGAVKVFQWIAEKVKVEEKNYTFSEDMEDKLNCPICLTRYKDAVV